MGWFFEDVSARWNVAASGVRCFVMLGILEDGVIAPFSFSCLWGGLYFSCCVCGEGCVFGGCVDLWVVLVW